MSIKRILRLDKKLPWGVIGLLVTILIAIYPYFFHDPKPELTLEILSETNVLSINDESISDVTINFKGENLNDTGRELKIFILKMSNEGNRNILPGDFQPKTTWGLDFPSANIIDYAITSSNSDKIKKNIEPTTLESKIIFTPVIFEKDKYFIMKILVLAPKKTSIPITHLGSIADVDEVRIFRQNETEKKPLLNRAFSGDVAIQALRTLGYAMVFILLVFAIAGAADAFSSYQKQKLATKREKIILEFKMKRKPASEQFGIISQIYQRHSLEQLVAFYEFISNPKQIDEYFKWINNTELKEHKKAFEIVAAAKIEKLSSYIYELIPLKSVTLKNGTYVLDSSLQELLKSFIEFVNKKN